MTFIRRLTAALIASAALTFGAQAETFRAATYLVDGNFQTRRGLVEFADALDKATDGAIRFDVFTGGVLLPAKSLLGGIGDGVAQLGFHTTNYTPSDLPVIYALSGMGFRNPDPWVLGLAFTDWLMHEPEGQADYLRHGVVPVGGFSTAPYELICSTPPIRTAEDLRGKKLRFPGGTGGEAVRGSGLCLGQHPRARDVPGLAEPPDRLHRDLSDLSEHRHATA